MSKTAESIFQRDDSPLSVAILLLNETSLMEVAATIDPMRAANRFANRTLFSWTIATPSGAPARLTSAVLFPANVALQELPHADVLIVLAGFNHSVHAPPEVTRHLQRISNRYRAIGGVDSGTWVLAQAGLLDNRSATLHWEDLEAFAHRFPDIDVRPDRFVVSENRFTAGGAAPALDLMLHLIGRRYGPALAAQVAGAFIYDPANSRNQSQYSVATSFDRDHIVNTAAKVMSEHVEDPLPMHKIAANLQISPRQLEMRFRTNSGTSPYQFALNLRLQAAARLARDTASTFTEIALQTGFASQAVFSRAFRRKFDTSPTAYRQEFNTIIALTARRK